MTPRRVLVVGAGGSGIPLAARLSDAGHRVVLVEAGPSVDLRARASLRDPWSVAAAMPGSELAWTYDAELLPGRTVQIGRGRLVGGSSAVNGALFHRPHPEDFASWAGVAGPEWSYEASVPALRRLEDDRDFGAGGVHGSAGPMPVERPGVDDLTSEAFIAAALSAGARRQDDKNGVGPRGVGPMPRNVRGGERWSVARGYADLLVGVEVVADAQVSRVQIEDGVARGIELHGGRILRAEEVVISAGALETPRLLQASGIGDRTRLRSAIVHRPGVGRALSDHAVVPLAWSPRPGAACRPHRVPWTAGWSIPVDEVGSGAVEILHAAMPTSAVVFGDPAAGGVHELRVGLMAPIARGDVDASRRGVRYGYLESDADRQTLRAAVRLAADMMRSPEFAPIVADADLPPDGSDARVDVWIRERLGTSLHASGTARMGAADDEDAVVDARGRVFGVAGLRVADTSILPRVPTTGTALAAVFVGERIAELMLAERGSGS